MPERSLFFEEPVQSSGVSLFNFISGLVEILQDGQEFFPVEFGISEERSAPGHDGAVSVISELAVAMEGLGADAAFDGVRLFRSEVETEPQHSFEFVDVSGKSS